jgi:ElaB/YqjD/DUF883 family membrane-anchored ribosome-binding protein
VVNNLIDISEFVDSGDSNTREVKSLVGQHLATVLTVVERVDVVRGIFKSAVKQMAKRLGGAGTLTQAQIKTLTKISDDFLTFTPGFGLGVARQVGWTTKNKWFHKVRDLRKSRRALRRISKSLKNAETAKNAYNLFEKHRSRNFVFGVIL